MTPIRCKTVQQKIYQSIAILGLTFLTFGCSVPKPSTKPDVVEKYRKTIDIENNTIEISFLENGDPNGQTYVLVHGTPGSALGWADYLASPPPNSLVIAVDRLGFGKSSSSRSFPNLDVQASAINRIIPSQKQNIILVGHSLGGPIVAQYAITYPDRVKAIVFLASSLDPALEKIHPMQYVGEWFFVKPFLPDHIRNANQELLALKPQLETLMQNLGKIHAKVVIVHGEDDDLVPVENVQFLKAHLSSAKCVKTIIIPKQNHFLPWNSEGIVRNAMQIALNPDC
jgi:pimeloyl-ACP methyl ester carboxylesterase